MDRDQADAAFDTLTLEQRRARAELEQRKRQDARAVAGQKRMALAVLAGTGAGATLGYALYGHSEVPAALGGMFGVIVGSVLRNRTP